MAFVHSASFLCQQILTEQDGVSSAIRIVDLFWINEQMIKDSVPVPMALLIHLRLTADDDDRHSLSVNLIRPNGTKTPIMIFADTVLPPAKYGSDTKLLIVSGQIGVKAEIPGKHRLEVLLDGKEIDQVVFIFAMATGESPKPN